MKKFMILFIMLFLAGFGFSSTANYAYILEVDSTSAYPTTIYPNSEVSINVTLENISGTVDAEDVNVSLVPTSNNFEIILGADQLDVIKFGQTGNFALRFKVKDSVKGGYYSIPLKIEYLRDGIEQYTINTQTTINVSNYDKINLVMTEYPLDKKYLDEKVELKGYVKNEGNNTLKGIKVEADFGTNKLIALDEKTKFLGDLDPGQTKDIVFTFLISKNATPALFEVDLNSNAVESISDLETVSFIVEDKPNIIISSIDKSLATGETQLKQGSLFSLSVQLENISKSTVKSAMMKIPENDLVEGTDLAYVGSLEEDDSSSGIFDLRVLDNAKTGSQKLNVEISYLDQYDKEYIITKEIPLYIVKKDVSYVWIFYIILIIGIGVGIYFYRKNKVKKKELRSLKGN